MGSRRQTYESDTCVGGNIRSRGVFAFIDVSYGRLILVYLDTAEVFVSCEGANCLATDKHVLIWKDYFGVTVSLYAAASTN